MVRFSPRAVSFELLQGANAKTPPARKPAAVRLRLLFAQSLAIALPPAFGCRIGCREGSGEHRARHPEGELGGGLAGFVRRRLGLRNDFTDPLLGLGLRESGAGSDHLAEIRLVVAADRAAGCNGPGENAPRLR